MGGQAGGAQVSVRSVKQTRGTVRFPLQKHRTLERRERRHSADTTSLVLEGELHVIDVDPETGAELSSRIRKVGDYAHKGPGDVHMERGGPEGALVLFSLYAPDGLLAETLTKDGSVLSQSTTEPILAKINARAR